FHRHDALPQSRRVDFCFAQDLDRKNFLIGCEEAFEGWRGILVPPVAYDNHEASARQVLTKISQLTGEIDMFPCRLLGHPVKQKIGTRGAMPPVREPQAVGRR